jgi:hypothetical protein
MMAGISGMEEDSSQKLCVVFGTHGTPPKLFSSWLFFHLAFIKPCHFRFSIASKEVGFMITALRRITTKFFDVYFHLWRDDGPNWRKEFCKWEEEDSSWMLVTRKQKSKSRKFVHFTSPICQKSPSPNPSYVVDYHALSLVVFIALLIFIKLLIPSLSPACFMTVLVSQSL